MRNRISIRRDSGEGKLLFRDGDEAAPKVTYAIEIWQNLIQAGAESVPGLKDGAGRVTVADRNLKYHNESEYVLQLRDGSRIPIIVTWSVPGITHDFVASGELSPPTAQPPA